MYSIRGDLPCSYTSKHPMLWRLSQGTVGTVPVSQSMNR